MSLSNGSLHFFNANFKTLGDLGPPKRSSPNPTCALAPGISSWAETQGRIQKRENGKETGPEIKELCFGQSGYELSASICSSNLNRLPGEVIGPFPLLPHWVGDPRAHPTTPLRGPVRSVGDCGRTPQVLCNRDYEQPDLGGFLFTCWRSSFTPVIPQAHSNLILYVQ